MSGTSGPILVVDDRAVDRRLLRTLLEHRGYRVVEASDGDEALSLIRKDRFALVVSDILLPRVGGYELARRLRAGGATANLPIVLCSAHFTPREADGVAAALDVTAVLAKPFEPEDLYRIVESCLGKAADVPPAPPRPLTPTPVPPELVELLAEKLFDKVQQLELLSGDRQALLGALVRAQEEERRRIAGELHDDAVQVMFGAVLMLQALNRHPDVESVAAVEEVVAGLSAAGERLRRLMLDLQPPSADGQSLGQVLTRAVERAAKAGGFETSVKDSLSVDPSAEQFTVAYRIAQEALANAVRHAGASRVTVVLEDRDRGVAIRVEDDGVGCAPDALRARGRGLGLTAMRERAQLAGGWWRIDSDPSRPGTVVAYWVPHSAG
jgi:signal transduction histidine kinase